MIWKLRVQDGAKLEIGRLPTEDLVEEAVAIIDDLAEDPFPSDALKMRGYKDRYRIRFGSEAYRLVYKVDATHRLVTILRVRPRPTDYRGMRNP
jgi:mRNA-degrading endonuclease RelE of RelBE toxin-antitoxin system